MWPGETDDDDEKGRNSMANMVAQKVVERTGEKVSVFHYEAKVATYSTQIEEWLYLGNAENASNRKQMLDTKGHVITHCLNCRINGKTPFKEVKYCVLKLVDEPAEELSKQLKIAYEFISGVEAKKGDGSKLLIHCDGIKDGGKLSRSTAILIGYLMKRDKIKYKDAHAIVKRARDKHYQKMTVPNHGFVQQLKKMYKRL